MQTTGTHLQGSEARTIASARARAIAKEAYIYGFPLVDSYRILHAYFVDASHPEYKGKWNAIHNMARLYTPADKAVQGPNSDTPYSMLGADLRAEPLILTVPEIEAGRYYSVQFIDLYTFNFAYVGTRTTGNATGSFLLAGPDWKGHGPPGIKKAIKCETQFALLVFRTQLYGSDDIENVKRVQAGFRIQTLSQFLGRPAQYAEAPEFITPLGVKDERTSLEFFKVLNFVLQFCPLNASEASPMARFAELDIGAGESFEPKAIPSETRQAIMNGITDAWAELKEIERKIGGGSIGSGDVFGTRAHLRNNFILRMAAAVAGIYGNSQEEAFYLTYHIDALGAPLDGSRSYTLRFAPDHLPPVNAFWSLTMYELPSRLLVANPLNRYLINSPMLPGLVPDSDGGLTLLIQHSSPGKAREANWLPAPVGPFVMALRLYWPKSDALNGRWKAPHLRRAG